MKHLRNVCLITFLLVTCSLLGVAPATAQEEIASSQDVLYRVSENGTTHVSHTVSLTNLTTTKYAAEYSLFVGFVDVENVSASDSQGVVTVDVTTMETGTDMHLYFNDQVVGKGNVLTFTLSYDTKEIASQNGRIWEIIIPRIKDSSNLTDYTARLSVPLAFGKATFIKPESAGDDLFFEKQDVLKGISVLFGDHQIFDFTLSYHIANTRLYPITTKIALPPETAYQQILLDQLTPKPLTVEQDEDGNWLAQYRLEGSEDITVTARGKAKLFHNPENTNIRQSEILNTYLLPQPYWESDNVQIGQKANELKTARAIYDYIVETLTYDYGRIEKNLPRAGALAVFNNPTSAICIEFTDLFITMARAAGIPAREVDGFAYTENSRLRPLSLVKDILHAWPEYYDNERKQWISVDPTWGNTSGIDYFNAFDFNHFAFVLKGKNSEYPYPAGSYKEEGDAEKKDITVSFAKDESFDKKEKLSLGTDIAAAIPAGIPTTANLRITNEGNALFTGSELSVTSEEFGLFGKKEQLRSIPPYGQLVVPVKLQSVSFFDNKTSTINVRINGREYSLDVRISPLYLIYLPWIIGGTSAAIILISAKTAWHLRVQRQKGHDSLRGQGQQPSQQGG